MLYKRNQVKTDVIATGKVLWLQLLSFGLGFFTARTHLFGNYAPLGVAFTAGVPGEFTFSAAVGALLGYLLPAGGESNIGAMGATALAALLCWLIRGMLSPTLRPGFSALAAGGSLGAIFAVLALAGEHNPSIAAIVGESFLTAGAGYFFYEFFHALSLERPVFSMNRIASGAVALTLLLTAFMSFSLGDFLPARLLGIGVVLYAARYGKEPGGAITGIAVGFGVYLAQPARPEIALGLALGGLIGGIFAPLGKIGSCVGFIITNGLVMMANYTPSALSYLYEVLVATVAIMVLPGKVGQFFAKLFSPAPQDSMVEGLRNSMVLRLNFAAEAVEDVSQTVEEVSGKLKQLNAPDFEQIFVKTEQTCCTGCGMRMYCWESARGKTLSCLLDGVTALRQTGVLSPEDIPQPLNRHCTHLPRLVDGLAQHFSDFIAKDSAERRLEEIRGVIAEQFQGIAGMLKGLGEELETARRYDYTAADSIRSALVAMELIPLDISCQVDKYQRLTAEIRLRREQDKPVNRTLLLRKVGELCDREFEVPAITETDQTVLLTLSEKAVYSVDFGVAQHSYKENKLCGDAYQGFYDGRGRFVMMVSDGMGKGGRAAVDGAMASGLMAQLMKAGFDPQSALKIVNAAMLYKSTDESLATVDVTVVDLFSGVTDFYKAGAPSTLLLQNGKVVSAAGEALPAGILQGVSFHQSQTVLSQGDMVVMMSDGAAGDDVDWMGVELETWKYGSAANLAEHLADYARRRGAKSNEDDITVAVAIIQKGY